jgi:cysteinyl-tRNA synthetase
VEPWDKIGQTAEAAVYQWEELIGRKPLDDRDRERLIVSIAGRMRGLMGDMQVQIGMIRSDRHQSGLGLREVVAMLTAYREELRAAKNYAVSDRLREIVQTVDMIGDKKGTG